MERWQLGRPVGSVHGRCRVHRAEILRLRGANAEAEREALQACEDLRPYLRRELGWPLTELGRIRLLRGDTWGANDAFIAAHSLGWDPQPGLALVQLAAGNAAMAAASIRDALEHPSNVPSKERPPNTELRRAPLLEAQIEIEVELGELGRARAAAEELARIASRFASKALAAGAAQGTGRVELAAGDVPAARRHGPVVADDRGEGGDLEALPRRSVAAIDPSGPGSKRKDGVALRGVDGWHPAGGTHPFCAATVTGRARRDLPWAGSRPVMPGDCAAPRSRALHGLTGGCRAWRPRALPGMHH